MTVALSGCSLLGFGCWRLTGCDHYSGWSDQVRELANHSWVYAQLSQNVYHGEYTYELGDRFQLVSEYPDHELDFYASLFHDLRDGEYVLVFRGTDTPEDWVTGNNPMSPRQAEHALRLYDSARNDLGLDPMAVAGHSLGGGLAIHVSLNRPVIAAYSFNGSPVFRQLGEPVENERYSIAEYGEILKIGRIFGREATQQYTSIDCTEDRLWWGQHGMQLLATCLTQIAAIAESEAMASLVRNGIEFEYPEPQG